MIVAIMIVASLVAAAYLLRPLLLAILAILLVAVAGASAAPPPASQVSVGLLLLAIDARRDHLRISEALRISNTGLPKPLTLNVALPASAQYVTFHRGLRRPVETAEGFVDHPLIPTGITEVAYSYAIPSQRRTVVARSFPLRVQRLEIVVRGRGVRLLGMRGQALPPLDVGGESVARWEVTGVGADEPVILVLDDLPTSHPWRPVAASGALAAALCSGLLITVRRRRLTSVA